MRGIAARVSIAVGIFALVFAALVLYRSRSTTTALVERVSAAQAEAADFEAEAASAARANVVAAAIWLVLLVAGVGFAIRQLVVRRLTAIRDQLQREAGQATDASVAPLTVGGADEIGDLAASFNVLAASLAERHNRLKARAGELTDQLAQLRRELASAVQTAEAANRARNDFLANVSHEVRTPMNAILGMTELALDTELTAQQREYLEVVQDASDSLLTVITDVLDYSTIEAGKLDLDRTAFSLRERISGVMKSASRRAHEKGLELACRIHSGVPEAVAGDPNRLVQILTHLVGNAVKFTDRGEIVAEVRREPDAEGEVVLHFTVADTGIGIPKDKVDVIFEAFTQADGSRTRQHEGIGLGLAICSRLVQMMGGRIWAESEPGKGSRMHFTARFQQVTARQAGVRITDPVSLQGVRVLVVDDNATNRRILEGMLENWGMRPVSAPGAAEAIRGLDEARARGEPYRLLVSDVHMPSVDGFTLAEWIRAKTELKDTTLILLTSGPRPEDARRVQELSIAAYLTKPVKQSELYEAIGTALGVNTLEESNVWATPREEKAVLPPLRILVAEDSVVNQKLAVGLLEKHGHRVQVAANGRETLEALASTSFDAVFMDVEMPEMDGLEATTAIREQEKRSGMHLPIIAMTAHAMKGDRERCLAAGMDDYVSKPIRAAQLFRTLESVLTSLGRLDAPASLPRYESALSPEEALRAVGGDRSLLCSLIQTALEEAPGLLAEIHEAIAEKDAGALRRLAHKLKASLRCFGPTAAFDRARKMEEAATGNRLDEAGAMLDRLEEEVKQLLPALSNYLEESECA